MPIRTGAEFLESLKDGRQVWLMGEKVEDVTIHPVLGTCAKTFAGLYDLQHDRNYKELLTMESPTSGELVSSSYLLPHSYEDVACRHQLIEFWARRSGAVAGRLPDYQAIINVGVYDARQVVAEENPEYGENVARWFEYMRDNDLLQTHGFADPPRDRSRPKSDLEYLKIVERKPDGIVVRGAKAVATISPYAHEFLCLTPFRPDIEPEEVLYFAVPINTKGLHIICRPTLQPPNPEDHPLSPYWDEMDATIVFDDVFVPQERIFYIRSEHVANPAFYGQLFYNMISWALWHILVRATLKTEILLGILAAMTDYLGTSKRPEIQLALADVIVYVESLKAMLHKAETNHVSSPSGLVVPNPTQVTIGRIMVVQRHAEVLQLVRELCGSGILMSPGQAELANPAVSPYIDRYFVGKDERAPDRFRMLKLAWEYAADSFGGRQLLFEMYNAGGVALNKTGLMASYDLSQLVHLAKEVAGITGSSPEGKGEPGGLTPPYGRKET